MVTSVIGALIVAHAVLASFEATAVLVSSEANAATPLVESTAGIGDSSGWFTEDLFQPSDPQIGVTIDDALAALVRVVAGTLVSTLIVRLAPTSGARP